MAASAAILIRWVHRCGSGNNAHRGTGVTRAPAASTATHFRP